MVKSGEMDGKNDIIRKIYQLILKYENVVTSGKLKKYTEEETKKDFILPLFEALGWDTQDRNEVSAEESQSSGRVDYGFYINERVKFYVEVKSLKSDLHREEYANQAIRYSWNKGVSWAILTDFQSIKVFNAQAVSQYLTDKLYFEIPCGQYIERFGQLWLLSKEAFKTDSIDREAEKVGKKLQKIPVGELLYKDLNKCREILTNDLSQWNEKVDRNLLEEGIQRILDRLIFLRVAEDRGIEPSTLRPLVRKWEGSNRKVPLYKSMVSKFRELDEVYNSSLFLKHPFEDWKDYSDATKRVINILYGKKGYYEYDFKLIPTDVLGAVYENYLEYRLSQSKKGLTLGKDVKKRKEQGVYYTPNFIVDYIVKNSLKPVLDKCRSVYDLKRIKVLDPACGSGSFLIKALEVLAEKYKEFNYEVNAHLKIQILGNNLYGVDLDPQAIEIARLNLLINVLEERVKLPLLVQNIKNGNSLISGADRELKKYFGKNFRDKKPFNWEEQFPEVFRQGGFDVIIGNPPYVSFYSRESHLDEYKDEMNFLIDQYELTKKYPDRRLNTVMFFIEKSLTLIKTGGYLGFIIDANFLEKPFRALRTLMIENGYIIKTSKKFSGFTGVTSDQVLLFVQKLGSKEPIEILESDKERATFTSSTINISREEFKEDTLNLNQRKLVFSKGSMLPLAQLAIISTGVQIGIGGARRFEGQSIEKLFYSEIKKTGNYYENISLSSKHFFRYCPVRTKNYLNLDEDLAFKINKNVKKCNIAVTKAAPFKNEEKIFIRQSSDSITATFGSKKHISEYSAFMVKPLEKSDWYYILAILNSKLITFYAKQENIILLGNKKQPQIRSKGLKKLLFPNNIGTHTKKSLSDKAKLILQLNKELFDVTENSNKWHEIKDKIKKTDKKIDEEVYKLYGLTPEEIEL